MEKNNKLIAEFMQKGSEGLGLYDYNGKHYKLYELKFHTSWDWLMPVVQKCCILNNEEGFEPFYDLCELKIATTHQAVVEFIKNQKKLIGSELKQE